jgi:hypothetical protein
MRTTLTLDPDVAALLKKALAKGDQSFKDVVNTALRKGLESAETAAKPKRRFVQRVWPNGGGVVPSPAEVKRILLEQDVERFLRDSGRR